MPSFKKLSATSFIYGWNIFGDYEITQDTSTLISLTYSEDRAGPLNPERNTATIAMTVVDDVITKVVWRNEEGGAEAVLNGLSFDADAVRLRFDERVDGAWRLYDMMVSGGTTFSMVAQTADGDAGLDVTTGVGDDLVRASGGSSYIKDFGGADRYIGDGNFDTVTYDEWFWNNPERVVQGVRADLAQEYAVGPDGMRDVLINIDEIRGCFKRDILKGDSGDNRFMGFDGSDTFYGRGGFDRVSYRNDERQGGFDGVTVNLGKGYAIDGFGKRDTLVSIEGAEGTNTDDLLIDSKADNYLRGRDGDDRFIIRGGDDYVDGEGGADTFEFRGQNFGDNTIEGFNPEEGDRIRITSAGDLGDLEVRSNESGEQTIYFNDSEIFLDDYFGSVAEYLIF